MADTRKTRRTLEQQLRDNEVAGLELGLKAHTQLDRDEESVNNQATAIRARLEKGQAQLDSLELDRAGIAEKREALTEKVGSRKDIEARIAELTDDDSAAE